MFGLFAPSHTVEEIHAEIDSAQDRLLNQAEQLLKELNIPTESRIEDKARKLASMGFVASEAVKQAENLWKSRKKVKAIVVATQSEAELIKYFKFRYPFQKFLTIKELDRICEKYDLIQAPARNYIKDVPEKNVREMVAADKLRSKDSVQDYFVVTSVDYDRYNKKDKTAANEVILSGNLRFTIKPLYTWEISDALKTVGIYEGLDITWFKAEKVDRSGLFVAAPKSHFDLTGLSKKTKHGFFNVAVTEVKDPIVFEYCKGDMIRVITKWGTADDQSYLDPALVNEKFN